MKSYFFNAETTTDLQAHPSGYDREYDADDMAAYMSPFLENSGVLMGNVPNACEVYVKSGTTLGVRPGTAYAMGRMVIFSGVETIKAKTGIVVARMNKQAAVRDFQLTIVSTMVQNATGDLYDIPLAGVTVSGTSVTLIDRRVPLQSAVKEPAASFSGAPVKTTIADADSFAVSDSADSGKTKRVSISDARRFLNRSYAESMDLVVNAGYFSGPKTTAAENGTFTAGTSTWTMKRWDLPFGKTYTHIPKRVFMLISPERNSISTWKAPTDLNSTYDSCLLLEYTKDGKFNAVAFAPYLRVPLQASSTVSDTNAIKQYNKFYIALDTEGTKSAKPTTVASFKQIFTDSFFTGTGSAKGHEGYGGISFLGRPNYYDVDNTIGFGNFYYDQSALHFWSGVKCKTSELSQLNMTFGTNISLVVLD